MKRERMPWHVWAVVAVFAILAALCAYSGVLEANDMCAKDPACSAPSK